MKTKNPGRTLVEMIIALTIFGIFMAAVFGVVIPMFRGFNKSQVRHELYMQTQLALKTLNRAVSESFGWMEGDSLWILLISKTGDTVSIYRDVKDSNVYINNKPVFPAGYRVIEFKVNYQPICDSAGGMAPAQCYEIADIDQNGLIQGTEISKVASLEMELTAGKAKQKYTGSTFPSIPPAIVDINIGEQ